MVSGDKGEEPGVVAQDVPELGCCCVRSSARSPDTQKAPNMLAAVWRSQELTNRGHGTYVENDMITSSVAGTLERVNKLISVRPLSTRYVPEVGDLVIGRIVEVAGQRWKVEANARQDAVLMLSSVNLPGGVQRRKVESDSLKMREFLAEGDVSVFPCLMSPCQPSVTLGGRQSRSGQRKEANTLAARRGGAGVLLGRRHVSPHSVAEVRKAAQRHAALSVSSPYPTT